MNSANVTRISLACSLFLAAILPACSGCAFERHGKTVYVWADWNTLGAPAIFVEEIRHQAYAVERVTPSDWTSEGVSDHHGAGLSGTNQTPAREGDAPVDTGAGDPLLVPAPPAEAIDDVSPARDFPMPGPAEPARGPAANSRPTARNAASLRVSSAQSSGEPIGRKLSAAPASDEASSRSSANERRHAGWLFENQSR
jgi:hypothetical protein